MPVAETTSTIVVTKAVAVGGLSTALMALITNSEIMSLLVFGLLTSLLSYFYDWAKSHPRTFTVSQLADLLKGVFYGIGLMFIGFYGMLELSSGYIELPKIVWGFISAFMAGSAVKIVEYIFKNIKDIFDVGVAKIKDIIKKKGT